MTLEDNSIFESLFYSAYAAERNSMDRLRVPKEDPELERQVVGIILTRGREAMKECIRTGLVQGDFTRNDIAWVYYALLALFTANKSIDKLSLTSKLSEIDKLKSVGGSKFIDWCVADLENNPEAIGEYSRDLVVRSACRGIAKKTKEFGSKQGKGILQASQELREQIREFEKRCNFERVIDAHMMANVYDPDGNLDMDLLFGRSTESSMLRTGIGLLDEKMTPWGVGDLVVMAGRPGAGKTAVLTQVSANVARRYKDDYSILFSFEMPKKKLNQRIIAQMTGIWEVCLHDRSSSDYDVDQLGKIFAAAESMTKARLFIEDRDTCGNDVGEILRVVDSYAKKYGKYPRLIGIDQLDRLAMTSLPQQEQNNAHTRLGKIAQALKDDAGANQYVCLLLAAINRAGANEDRPAISHIANSGQVEFICDVGLIVHRPEMYEKNVEKKAKVAGLMELIIDKNRNGDTGIAKLWWHGSTMSTWSSSRISLRRSEANDRIIEDYIEYERDTDSGILTSAVRSAIASNTLVSNEVV